MVVGVGDLWEGVIDTAGDVWDGVSGVKDYVLGDSDGRSLRDIATMASGSLAAPVPHVIVLASGYVVEPWNTVGISDDPALEGTLTRWRVLGPDHVPVFVTLFATREEAIVAADAHAAKKASQKRTMSILVVLGVVGGVVWYLKR